MGLGKIVFWVIAYLFLSEIRCSDYLTEEQARILNPDTGKYRTNHRQELKDNVKIQVQGDNGITIGCYRTFTHPITYYTDISGGHNIVKDLDKPIDMKQRDGKVISIAIHQVLPQCRALLYEELLLPKESKFDIVTHPYPLEADHENGVSTSRWTTIGKFEPPTHNPATTSARLSIHSPSGETAVDRFKINLEAGGTAITEFGTPDTRDQTTSPVSTVPNGWTKTISNVPSGENKEVTESQHRATSNTSSNLEHQQAHIPTGQHGQPIIESSSKNPGLTKVPAVPTHIDTLVAILNPGDSINISEIPSSGNDHSPTATYSPTGAQLQSSTQHENPPTDKKEWTTTSSPTGTTPSQIHKEWATTNPPTAKNSPTSGNPPKDHSEWPKNGESYPKIHNDWAATITPSAAKLPTAGNPPQIHNEWTTTNFPTRDRPLAAMNPPTGHNRLTATGPEPGVLENSSLSLYHPTSSNIPTAMEPPKAQNEGANDRKDAIPVKKPLIDKLGSKIQAPFSDIPNSCVPHVVQFTNKIEDEADSDPFPISFDHCTCTCPNARKVPRVILHTINLDGN